MYTRRLAAPDLTRTRFATSPLWETVASLRVISTPGMSLHEPWARVVRPLLAASDLDLGRLSALVPRTGYLADFLTPAPRARRGAFVAELDVVSRTPAADVVRDVRELLRGAGNGARTQLLTDALEDPEGFRDHVVDDLHRYWEIAVLPTWERLEALAEADVTWRLDQMAAGGVRGMFDTLHPRVRLDGHDLVVEEFCHPGPPPQAAGIVLVPCAFAWPRLLFLEAPQRPTMLTYSPRGVGLLWGNGAASDDGALQDLLGRTRARVLTVLDLPMSTGQVACRLRVSTAAASAHLKVLERASLIAGNRRGRRVLYSRTSLGEALGTPGGRHHI